MSFRLAAVVARFETTERTDIVGRYYLRLTPGSKVIPPVTGDASE